MDFTGAPRPSPRPGSMVCLTTCLHGVNKVYKEDAGDGAATGNIFCSGEQITERDVTTMPRETGYADGLPTPTRPTASALDVDVATATRVAAANDVPTIFNRPLARRKESNEASTNATVIDIRPAEEKEQRNGKPGLRGNGSVHVKRAQGRVKEVADRPRSYLLNVPKFGARPCDHFERVFNHVTLCNLQRHSLAALGKKN